jgi:hypothetical protein
VTDAERLQTRSVGESTILEAKEHRNYCALPRNAPSRFPPLFSATKRMTVPNLKKRRPLCQRSESQRFRNHPG